jgi:GT2 family glycosyltransferase
MSDDPKIAVVVVNYRTPALTMRCMAALRLERVTLPSLTAIVVDGGSGDGSSETLEEALRHPRYEGWASFLPLALNGGYGWANNQAILELVREGRLPDFIHLLNPDTEVSAGAVARLLAEIQTNANCGAVGSQLIAADGSEAASAFRFPSPGREFVGAAQSAVLGRLLGIPGVVVSPHDSREVDWVSGASVMFRAQALQDTGLFDDGFFLYFEEVELLHRLKARGWTVRHVPSSRVFHIEGASTGLGAAAVDRPFPPYWYQSRRRYFELTGGTGVLIAANLCSLTGQAVAGLKRIFGRPPASKSYRAVDFLRLGFWPSGDASRPSAPSLSETPGQVPAWMKRP